MTRRQVLMEGSPDAIVVKVTELLGQVGAHSFELAYDRHPVPLPEGQEPADDDPIVWRAVAVMPGPLGRRTVVGEHVVEAGQGHGCGIVKACAHLIEQLGGNVVLLDMGDRTDPR